MGRHAKQFELPSRTVQSEAETVNINSIVARARAGGSVPGLEGRQPRYIDVSEVGDYREALHRVRAAQEAFMELPAIVRARFENDPARLLVFLGDPANRPEAEKLGLVKPAGPAVIEPVAVAKPA
jgi:phage internal scaffolding protein